MKYVGKMRFCPKCGSTLMIKSDKMICPRCGYSDNKIEKIVYNSKLNHDKDKTIVADGKTLQGRVTLSICPKCGSARAFRLKKRLFKCVTCGYIYRS
jgi:DNA-directed RNA polymerase subunit M